MLKFQKKKKTGFILPLLAPPKLTAANGGGRPAPARHSSPWRDGGGRLCGENSSSGFSLVEVTLALMVVAIGMLSILGMFPAGLDQNARSISDTHAAMFAEEVFSSLRVHAETNWQEIGTAIIDVPAAANDNWYDPIMISLTNNIATNIYRHPGNSNLVDHAFRYRITLATNGLIKSATVRFWPDEFGKTNNPLMFYSEFYQMNR